MLEMVSDALTMQEDTLCQTLHVRIANDTQKVQLWVMI